MDNRGFSKRTYARMGNAVVSFPHVAFMGVLTTGGRPYTKIILENGAEVLLYSQAPQSTFPALLWDKQLLECHSLVSAWEEYLDL